MGAQQDVLYTPIQYNHVPEVFLNKYTHTDYHEVWYIHILSIMYE